MKSNLWNMLKKELRELLKDKETFIETQKQYIKQLKKENKI